MKRKKICVFSGSSEGKNSIFMESARSLGRHFAENNLSLVYGGASIGLMGAMADSCMNSSGEVYGVMPQCLTDLELGHKGITQLDVVGSMHERKAKMYDLSDAFIAFPGGMGTLEELFEIMTWAQLNYHNKPCYVLNINKFFDGMLQHLNHSCDEGFISEKHMKIFKTYETVEEVVSDYLSTASISS